MAHSVHGILIFVDYLVNIKTKDMWRADIYVYSKKESYSGIRGDLWFCSNFVHVLAFIKVVQIG
jgi:hypothetical protein